MKDKYTVKIITFIVIIGLAFAALSMTGCGGGNNDIDDTASAGKEEPGGQTPGGQTPGGQNPGGGSVQGNTLAEKLEWLLYNAQSDKAYLLTVNADEDLDTPYAHLSYGDRSNITITLKGNSGEKVIRYTGNHAFSMSSGVTLVLDENIILQSNQGSVTISISGGELVMNGGAKIIGGWVGVDYSGTFTMNGGAKIIGGRVAVVSGTFTMNGGEISDYTGGVCGVDVRETFIMNGGKISGNTGIGVNLMNGTFTMNGGEISDNTGNGVRMTHGTFTMNDGIISGNTSSYGGGVHMIYGTFTMNGGEISGNTASSSGGGVYIDNNGNFTMSGGEISGNNAEKFFGGGVHILSGTFTMSGGKISGNTANGYYTSGMYAPNFGGGVYRHNGEFIMTGGTISGNSATHGGGVYYNGYYFTTWTGGTISGNTATGYSFSGIYIPGEGSDVYQLK
jgi:hypothetical protein